VRLARERDVARHLGQLLQVPADRGGVGDRSARDGDPAMLL